MRLVGLVSGKGRSPSAPTSYFPPGSGQPGQARSWPNVFVTNMLVILECENYQTFNDTQPAPVLICVDVAATGLSAYFAGRGLLVTGPFSLRSAMRAAMGAAADGTR